MNVSGNTGLFLFQLNAARGDKRIAFNLPNVIFLSHLSIPANFSARSLELNSNPPPQAAFKKYFFLEKKIIYIKLSNLLN